MSRPFTFKINAAEFFAVVNSLHHKQRSTFLVQFSTDLITLEPVTEYGKKIVSETIDFINKQSEYGKTGGRPKERHPKGTLKAPTSKPKGTPKPKEEVEVKEEKKEYAEKVLMTEKQYSALMDKYGNIKTVQAIEKLSISKCANSKMKYDSDYHAILKWVIAAVEKDYVGVPSQRKLELAI